MTIIQKLRSQLVIRQVANRQGITYDQCYSSIAAAIDNAWATTDPETKHKQIELIGSSRKPTPEEFISLIAGKFNKST